MSDVPSDASMEQVRELLMGTHLKDMENRIKRQEERLLKEIADTHDSIKSRVESLENFMKSETASLLHRLQEEQAERSAALRDEQRERSDDVKNEQRERKEALAQLTAEFAADLTAREEALERKLTALSGTLDSVERELRQLLLTENAKLSSEMEEKYKAALNALASTAQQLRHDLVSRSAMAGIFTEATVRMSSSHYAEERPGDNVAAAPLESAASKKREKNS